MLDDLRQQASDDYEDEQEQQEAYAMQEERVQPRGNFLGMTPLQRLVLAVMMLMMVCVLGVFALIAFERVYLPFLI